MLPEGPATCATTQKWKHSCTVLWVKSPNLPHVQDPVPAGREGVFPPRARRVFDHRDLSACVRHQLINAHAVVPIEDAKPPVLAANV